MITLKTPTLSDQNLYEELIRRWKTYEGEEISYSMNPENKPFSEVLSDFHCLPEGWVPAVYYFIMESGRMVGLCNLRYGDNPYILNFAGHIGYGIAPWERRKGYATRALFLLKEEARKKGMQKVLLTCDDTNEGSRRTILANSGLYEKTEVTYGVAKEFYWIELKS